MNEPNAVRIPWQPIQPLSDDDRTFNGSLAALDALHGEWQRRLAELSELERILVRRRSLRRLAVETGIIERLYDVDWGLTLTMVAEGFTHDVVERAGGVLDDRTLAILRAQLDSLEMVLDFVRDDRPLGPALIRELHQAIVRTQDTYTATDSLGRVVETPLPKGIWKSQPNHVLRQDNTLLEYAPPEQVASEIDRLVELWNELDSGVAHPIIKAAWLHHRFVQIHPFADGNGRVARALTLLVFEKHRYAPLVVDRWHRDAYLRALDAANDGRLRELIKLFVKLEGAALANELDRPMEVGERGVAVDVAHTLAEQIARLQRDRDERLQHELVTRAVAVTGRIERWVSAKRAEIDEVFRSRGLTGYHLVANTERPPSERAQWFRYQVIDSAHAAGHYADFRAYAAWSSLRIRLERWQLRFVASVHGAGREPGVMAVTTWADLAPIAGEPADRERQDSPTASGLIRTTTDAFRFVHTESVDAINARASELEDLLDEGLALALAALLATV